MEMLTWMETHRNKTSAPCFTDRRRRGLGRFVAAGGIVPIGPDLGDPRTATGGADVVHAKVDATTS